MCMFSAKKDNSAEIARQAEEKRQANIQKGLGDIDGALSGFNDDYYGRVADNYSNYYKPQIDDQFGDAQNSLALKLARSGLLGSSVQTTRQGKLQRRYGDAQAQVAEGALNASRSAKQNVNSARSALINDLYSTANPQAAAAAAQARASALTQPQSFSPIANMFVDLTNIGSTAVQAEREGYVGTKAFLPGSYGSGSSGSLINS